MRYRFLPTVLADDHDRGAPGGPSLRGGTVLLCLLIGCLCATAQDKQKYSYDPSGPRVDLEERFREDRERKLKELDEVFDHSDDLPVPDFSDAEAIRNINASVSSEYLLGPGDIIGIQVWGIADLSATHTIGPAGAISMPLIGETRLEGLSRREATERITKALGNYYQDVSVNIHIQTYRNNRVFVLGRVTQPGMLQFDGTATLLEAISRAGAISPSSDPNPLGRCAVIRGRNKIIWIDLQELLVGGNISLNLTLANNDILYIPDLRATQVYVMGEVTAPGAYRLLPGMTFLDALMMAGGPTEDGNDNKISLIRNRDGKGSVFRVEMDRFRKGDYGYNVVMNDGDIIFVSRRGAAKFNYILQQINPFAQLLVVNEALSE